MTFYLEQCICSIFLVFFGAPSECQDIAWFRNMQTFAKINCKHFQFWITHVIGFKVGFLFFIWFQVNSRMELKTKSSQVPFAPWFNHGFISDREWRSWSEQDRILEEKTETKPFHTGTWLGLDLKKCEPSPSQALVRKHQLYIIIFYD